MADMPDWKRADLIALGQNVPAAEEPKREMATRKATTEKAVKE